jgi:hypothetical protein
MPEFTFTSPSGQKFNVTGPEGATKEQAFEKFKSMKPELFGEAAAAPTAAPEIVSRGTVGAAETAAPEAPMPRLPKRGGFSKQIGEALYTPAETPRIPTAEELAGRYADIGTGALQGIPTAIPGLPGDIESMFRKDTVLPTSQGIANYMFGEPSSPDVATGRALGGMVAGPVAGGLSKAATLARVAELPKIARAAQSASTIIDPLSPAISGTVNAAKNALRPAEAAAPTTNALRAAAEADYAVMDNSNLAIHPDVLRSTIADVKKSLEKSRYVEELDPTARNFLKVLEDRAQTPQSLTQLDALRGKARDLAYEASGGEQKVLSTISRKLDTALNDINSSNVVPKDPLLPAAAPDTVKDALVSARDKFGRAARSAEIETLIHRADASTTDNPIKALRTQFSSLAKNEDRLAQYTPAEQKVIKDIADGNIGSKSLQTLENLMPGFSRTSMFGNLMSALAGAAGHAATGPFGSLFFAAPGAIGKAAESARGAQAMPIANQFAASIRGGNALPPQGMPASAVRDLLSPGATMYSGANALADRQGRR